MNIAVFAPKPGCGASTVSRLLALTLAKESPVLLVELDFYYPSTSIVLGAYHEERNLDHGLDVFNRKGNDAFKLSDFIVQYRKTKLSILCPHGKKGFEYFPKENPEFVPAILNQAKQAGFEHVILDTPSLVDTVFCMSALQEAEKVLFVLNDEYANALLYHHRTELFKEMNIHSEIVLIANQVRPKSSVEETIIKAIPDKEIKVTIPYVAKLHRIEKTGELIVPARLQKKLHAFLNNLNFTNIKKSA